MANIRTKILWHGPAPDSATEIEFKNRNLAIELITTPGIIFDSTFAISNAIVFHMDPDNKGNSLGMVKKHSKAAIDHGLRIVLKTNDSDHTKLFQTRLSDFPESAITYAENMLPHNLAEQVARHDSGVSCNHTLIIKGDKANKDSIFLLQRAFHDCESITLNKLTGGYSGAEVFSVQAVSKNKNVPSYPLPFFAKVDSWKKIKIEFDNYNKFVANSIPFCLRPNLERPRHILGANKGIIVGDFVENSLSLKEVIRTTEGRAAIHSLFDDTLRGWHQHAFSYEKRQESGFFNLMPLLIKTEHVQIPYVTQAKKKFGAKKTPQELFDIIRYLPNFNYRMGPIHGDLHTENIRVRAGEAILIDFTKTDIGPILADYACLEVSLAFFAAGNFEETNYIKTGRFKEWRTQIDYLYGEELLFNIIPPVPKEPSRYNWLWNTCRQIRLLVHSIEGNNLDAYGCMLAAYMLRATMFPKKSDEIDVENWDGMVISYAYAQAEKVLHQIQRRTSSNDERRA